MAGQRPTLRTRFNAACRRSAAWPAQSLLQPAAGGGAEIRSNRCFAAVAGSRAVAAVAAAASAKERWVCCPFEIPGGMRPVCRSAQQRLEIQHRKAAMDSLSSSPSAGCGTGPTRLKGGAPCAGATRRSPQSGAGPWGCAAPGDHFSVHANRACAGASGFCSCGPATSPTHRQCVAG